MRKFYFSFFTLLFAFVLESSAQYWQATLVIDNLVPNATKLRFKIKPVGGNLTNFQFDGMEYFVRRTTAGTPTTFGAVTANTVDFPGLEITKGGGNLNFENAYEGETNLVNYYFYGKSVSATTAPMTYTEGVEYEVFNVEVSAEGSSEFEFAANNEDSYPYYLTLTRKGDPGGQPDYTAISSHGDPSNHLFYGSVLSKSGANYYQKPGLLPVKFLSFYALKNGDAAKLNWTVADDANNQYFDVERSVDGRKYATFTRVNAFANGSAVNTYEASDPALSKQNSKVIYYRIKQFDRNGASIYSQVRVLNVDKAGAAMSVYPNPARSVTKLVVDAPEAGKAAVILRDGTGKQVQLINMQLVKGINQRDINDGMLPSGEYNISVVSDKLNQTIKLSKVN